MGEIENKKTNPSLQKKTAARLASVQCVYERLVSGEKPAPQQQVELLKQRLANNSDEQKLTLGMKLEPDYKLVKAILEGTIEWQADIGKRIDQSLSSEWTRGRMSQILIAILECAVFELFFYKDTKHKILIDEYTTLTRRFFADAEVNFVNGVLKNLHAQFHNPSPS